MLAGVSLSGGKHLDFVMYPIPTHEASKGDRTPAPAPAPAEDVKAVPGPSHLSCSRFLRPIHKEVGRFRGLLPSVLIFQRGAIPLCEGKSPNFSTLGFLLLCVNSYNACKTAVRSPLTTSIQALSFKGVPSSWRGSMCMDVCTYSHVGVHVWIYTYMSVWVRAHFVCAFYQCYSMISYLDRHMI